MCKTTILVGLTLLAQGAAARAQDAAQVVVPPPASPVAPLASQVTVAPAPPGRHRKWELGLSVVPMGFGRFSSTPGGMQLTEDAEFAYGLGLSLGYELLPGLTVGVAPQEIFNVKPKSGGASYKELDAMARIAYSYTLVDAVAVYAEVLPGYSFILPPDGDRPAGFVVAFGAGTKLDLGERAFAILGGGYQLGYQKVTFDGAVSDTRTKYVRITIGGGYRF